MAAAPSEIPAPLTTPDLPPAKRKKTDPSCLEILPVVVVPATATGGWSSLPDDLVRRIADSFLDTNDLDHYVGLRAVCPSWRAATDDPRTRASERRFCPRRWIVLDEVFQSDDSLDDRRMLLNTATSRIIRKKLPQLLDYHVVAATDGFFVLADRSPPHAARVFNPLTGHMVHFAAPVPAEVRGAYVGSSDKLRLILLGDSSRKLYKAVLDSEDFSGRDFPQGVYNFIRKAVVGGAYSHFNAPALSRAFCPLLKAYRGNPTKCFSSDLPGDVQDLRCFLVSLAGEVLVVMIAHGRPLFPIVFKMDNERGKLKTVRSISRFAIFIGHQRCLAVDVDNLPGIEANCVYYTEHLGLSAHICKYNIKDKKVERISEAAEFVKQDKKFVPVTDRPFTIIQLLCSYTINIPDSQLAALQQMS